jgi:oxazoline/thiazoline dehydrogenase
MNLLKNLQLSPYVAIRQINNELYLEQPLSSFMIPVQKNAILNLIFRFAKPTNCEEVLQQCSPDLRAKIINLIEFLFEKKVLLFVESDNKEELEKEMWEFHDLFFHTQSRQGLNTRPLGATYRFGKDRSVEENHKTNRWAGKQFDLEEDNNTTSPNFSLNEALLNRHTSYKFSSLNLSDISNLLFNSVKVTERANNTTSQQTLHRPYPSGGGLYSIDTYVAITNCIDLPHGLYYYDALKHKLILIENQDKFVRLAAKDAAISMSQDEIPSAMLIFSSRFERVFLKYESLAYRLILLEMGAIFQTLYLAATKLNLSVCALGSGNSSNFSINLGLEYLKETSIGEFAVNGKL